ncbi:MAG TPA: hypothetical protein VEW46_18340 [Pyrinomonadaceae bacterium]|nr:hypothetical protein [Pyrinomonadaceae bacterium]
MAAPTEPTDIVEVQGEALTPLDSFWLDSARNMAKESVGALEEAAKQSITVTTLAQSIYFAAISFGDVKNALGTLTYTGQWLVAGALVVPLICWLASLAYAVLVFKPEMYGTNLDSPELTKQVYEEIVAYKHQQLIRAHRLLVVGFGPLIINVVLYLIFIPAKSS